MQSLRLHNDDDVAIALADLPAASVLDDGIVVTRQDIPSGHKVALRDMPAGTLIHKYGQIIGVATCEIAAGDHVHSHNLGMADIPAADMHTGQGASLSLDTEPKTFEGYIRPDGRVGTRNYLGILSTVNCSGSVAKFIAEAFERDGAQKLYPHIDGVVPIVHSSGCGLATDGEGYATLFRTLKGYATNPNFAAVLLVGLGCEVMQISTLIGKNGLPDAARFRHLNIQDTGGTKASVSAGVSMLHELAVEANQARRETVPASHLMLGMQCGGSDGYSGLTSNPALGVASDLLVSHGGTSILSETPEIHGAEHLLTRRAVDQEIAQALMQRLEWWEDYTHRNFGKLDNNPSPGNKAGGLTTILEKSLGAVAKSGRAPLNGFYKYGQRIEKSGFVFMDSPGYDPCSITGQVASGANLIVFSTGRGSVSGFKPVPCIKLASNTAMYTRMVDDMDINCGDILEGVSLEDKGAEIFNQMLDVASGRQTKSEELGFGGVEFIPWVIGAVM